MEEIAIEMFHREKSQKKRDYERNLYKEKKN